MNGNKLYKIYNEIKWNIVNQKVLTRYGRCDTLESVEEMPKPFIQYVKEDSSSSYEVFLFVFMENGI